jgi:ADP-ribosylation factor GTPase-activating protein 1
MPSLAFPMVDPVAAEFFERQWEDAHNKTCLDSGASEPRWASVPHGIYISIGASGVHRSLGVKVSFVQSTTMDSWKPLHLRMMELGGNHRFQAFLDEHGVPRDMPIREKYQTRAAAWYRENLRAEAEGTTLPTPLEPGTGHLLTCEAPTQEQLTLDRIFAQAPRQGSMTQGGVPLRDIASKGTTTNGCSSKAKRCMLAGVMKSGRDQFRALVKAAVGSASGTKHYGVSVSKSEHTRGSSKARINSRPRSRSRCSSTACSPTAINEVRVVATAIVL